MFEFIKSFWEKTPVTPVTAAEKLATELLQLGDFPFANGRNFCTDSYKFGSSADRNKAIKWLSVAIELFVDLTKFANFRKSGVLSALGVHHIEGKILSCLLESHTSPKYPFAIHSERRNQLQQLVAGERPDMSHTITCRDVENRVAVAILKEVLRKVLTDYDVFKTPDKQVQTLACIRRFHPNSFFGAMPKDVFNIILEKVQKPSDMQGKAI